jgi:DNA-nicking Smr family endonuclease
MTIKRPIRGTSAAPADDSALFRAAVHDVTPLTQIAKPEGLDPARPRRRARRTPVEVIDESMALLPTGDSATSTIGGGDALSFRRAGVRTQVMRRLRRGLYPVENELDLHGLDQAAARDRLSEFIARNRDIGNRCVRVIHGKGYRSGARGPVLKAAVDSWLRRHLDVMAFTSARALDGGTGAVYVLLRV